ncbi:GNAT family N-acetyltransferase [Solilutibacter silvestris]|uniref:GNAT family N-acetyltransferase n=1 Tax=Solilutibacter silvestris TaxID=1645665 RepID=UPI000CA06848|nr:GNAT family N-acetyltransferase [Lysobacter silvestris]
MLSIMLLEMTEDLRRIFRESPNKLGEKLELSVPDGWPEFPDALTSPHIPGWPIFLFLDHDKKAILGSGGFLSAPDHKSEVQVGYEVAPAYRGQGIATAAMKTVLSTRSDACPIAVTSVESGPSVSVLRNLNFSGIGTHNLPNGTKVWMWARLQGTAG